jgi:hypothetical protein
MKIKSILFNLIGAMLCATTLPLAAANCFPCGNDCCEWDLCDGKITLGADWLYWKVTEDNLLLGSTSNLISEPRTEPLDVHASPLTQSFKYNSGFRVNLGYELPGNCWDINVCYTYLPGHSTSSTFNSTNPTSHIFTPNRTDFPILGTILDNELVQAPTSVSSKWNFNGNNVDVDMGRTVCFGECLKLRPHVGFRVTWFDQNLRFSARSAIAEDPLVQNYDAKFSQKFTGCGVEGGLWGEWQVGCGLSVVGHFGGSVLYSKFRLHERAVASNLTVTPGDVVIAYNCHSFRNATPTVDYFLGMQYETCFCDMLFSVHAGWEQHVLFDVNKIAHDGNLATQGLTLGLALAF